MEVPVAPWYMEPQSAGPALGIARSSLPLQPHSGVKQKAAASEAFIPGVSI